MNPILTNFNIDAKTRLAFSARQDRQIDWFRVLVELKGRGWTLDSISEAIGVPRTTVHSWTTDQSSPRYIDGIALMDLWDAVVATPPVIKQNTGNRTR